MPKEEKKVEEKEEESIYRLVEYPSQFQIGIKTPEGDTIDTQYALVEILNKLDKIVRAVA